MKIRRKPGKDTDKSAEHQGGVFKHEGKVDTRYKKEKQGKTKERKRLSVKDLQ